MQRRRILLACATATLGGCVGGPSGQGRSCEYSAEESFTADGVYLGLISIREPDTGDANHLGVVNVTFDPGAADRVEVLNEHGEPLDAEEVDAESVELSWEMMSLPEDVPFTVVAYADGTEVDRARFVMDCERT